SGLSSDLVMSTLNGRDGSLWVGTFDGGLNRVFQGHTTVYDSKNGLNSDFVLSLYEDRGGALWVGTARGVQRIVNGTLATDTFKLSGEAVGVIVDDSVFAILEDGNGYFWMSCNKGIFRVSRQQLDDFAEGLLPKVTSVAYGRADGMQSRECNGGTQPVAWKTNDGKLWFATVKGVAMIDPNRARAAAAPPVMIQDILADGHRMDPAGPLTLAAGTKTLEFRYAAINFAAPEKIHYQYRLEGFDHQWIDIGTRRIASYTNLKPGSYRFQVRAASD